MSVNPARIARLDDHGQLLTAGSPANLTLVDPTATWTVDRDVSHSLSRNNPWHGRTLTGRVVATFIRGACSARDGRALIPELVGGVS
jgi:dihydroorotase